MLIQRATTLMCDVDVPCGRAHRRRVRQRWPPRPGEDVLDTRRGTGAGLHAHHVPLHSRAAAETSIRSGRTDSDRAGLATALAFAEAGEDAGSAQWATTIAFAGPLDAPPLDRFWFRQCPLEFIIPQRSAWILNSAGWSGFGLATLPTAGCAAPRLLVECAESQR